MSVIQAGIVLTSKFVLPGDKAYRCYISYIDRQEAIRNQVFEHYNAVAFADYNDYMGNPEKTTALFTAYQERLSDSEQRNLKDAFSIAEKTGSPMWQHVISFDNRWLAENGMYDPETHSLNETKIKEAVRLSMDVLLQKENMKGTTVWSAAIHYNTDNIHIHIAMVEPFPTRKVQTNAEGQPEIRGKIKRSSFEAAKSSAVNTILGQQPEIQKIHQLRDRILQKRKDIHLMDDERMATKMQLLYQALPDNKQFWNYNSNKIHNLKPVIDDIVSDYLRTYHPEEFAEYKKLVEGQEKKYKTAYGNPKVGNHYAENKIKDLYARLGNTVLKELKEFDKQQKQEFYRHTKTRKTANQSNDSNTKPYPYPARASPVPCGETRKNNFSKKTAVCSRQFMNSLKQALKSDFENARNQQIYEQMQEEQEQKNQQNKGEFYYE